MSLNRSRTWHLVSTLLLAPACALEPPAGAAAALDSSQEAVVTLPPQPPQEVCNGIDDDQDGSIDEDEDCPRDVAAEIADLRLVNYYPAANGWYYMWDHWDADAIDADFGRIAGLGANAVRLIVHTTSFAVPSPSAASLERLAAAIDLAGDHGLRVQLTLFDLFSGYGRVEDSRDWVDAVVGPYQDDPRIVYIDVQNEVDTGRPEVVAWLQALVPHVRSVAGRIPVTASITGKGGLSQAQHMVNLAAAGIDVDLYDAHVYGTAAAAFSVMKAIKAAAGPVPLFIGETGASSYSGYAPYSSDAPLFGVPPNPAATEGVQGQFYRALALAADTLDLPPVGAWAYSDFTPFGIPPNLSVASRPREYHYGLHRIDGSEKPAAAAVRAHYAGAPVDTWINEGFEAADDGGLPLLWRLWSRPEEAYPGQGFGYTAAFARDVEVKRSGAASARIRDAIGTSTGMPAFYLTPVLITHPGQRYTATVYAKGEGMSANAYLTLSWHSASAGYLGKERSPLRPNGGPGWTQLSVTSTMPSDATHVEIRLEVETNPGATVWFDDLTFAAAD
ncbi:cellulase family glycosylhydrolase [Sorangium sp. So ce861]|uniref:cellulase family glycosylhydrolase n=1 Tax=Sorangium sp. So ce861 TaxID=3133323 RepID=UPI003F619BE0